VDTWSAKDYQKEIPPEQILEWINDHPELEKGCSSDLLERTLVRFNKERGQYPGVKSVIK